MNDAEELDITFETSEDNELITINFKSEDQTIAVGFNLQEAQILNVVLGETKAAALIKKLELFTDPSEKIH